MIELASAEEIELIRTELDKTSQSESRSRILENIKQEHEATEKARLDRWQARLDRAKAIQAIPKPSPADIRAMRIANLVKARFAKAKKTESEDERFERIWKEKHEDKSYYGR